MKAPRGGGVVANTLPTYILTSKAVSTKNELLPIYTVEMPCLTKEPLLRSSASYGQAWTPAKDCGPFGGQ